MGTDSSPSATRNLIRFWGHCLTYHLLPGSLSLMARQLRLEYDGALYHVTARGNGRQNIYLHDTDRGRFLTLLGEEVRQQLWRCYA